MARKDARDVADRGDGIGNAPPLMPTIPSDEALVAAVLDATRLLSTREAEPRTGISSQTLRRWRRGEWKRLDARTRLKAIRYLRRLGRMKGPPLPHEVESRVTPGLADDERARLIALHEEALRVLRGG